MNQKKIQKSVESIIQQVRRNGDRALISFAAQFDQVKLTPASIRVRPDEIKASGRRLAVDQKKALDACARRIEQFHIEEKMHVPISWSMDRNGVRLGQRYSAVESVGIYVPGGRFAYPSTLLMTAIPARVAGVKRLAVVTPPARLADEILYAASLAGVTEIYRIGGPAAMAALAIGTKTISKVDMIIGPGNALVTEAKRQLFGEVGIDLLAGPSELVVVADDSAEPFYVAADIAAQAEHDPDSKGILVTTSRRLAKDVKANIPSSLRRQCDIYVVPHQRDAIEVANRLAGEHVELIVRSPSTWLKALKNGGTIFIGPYSATAMGDYWAGPSHVLPTGRSARFGSGLSVMTFLKRSSLVEVSKGAYKKGWKEAYTVAEMEGLVQHAHSLKVRSKRGA